MRVVSHTSGRNVDALCSTAEWPLIFSARGVCYVPGVWPAQALNKPAPAVLSVKEA